jgi:methionyl-tRNA formyltransferase
MAGDSVTGVTIIRMEAGLDSGPILLQRAVGIDINDTSATLHDELAREGAELLELALKKLRAGTLYPVAQDEKRASHAPKLRKEEGRLDFSLPARTLHARIRGLVPWPGALMFLRRAGLPPLAIGAEPGVFPLSPAMLRTAESFTPLPGAPAAGAVIGLVEGALLVACSDGCYAFTRLRPAGRGPMDATGFFNGYLATAASPFFA